VLLENVVAKNPYHATAHYELGVIFQQLDMASRAQYHLEAAVRYEPANVMFCRTFADFCYVVSANKHRALELYSELIASNPRDTELLQLVANICIELGMYDASRPFINALIALEPDNLLAHQILEALSRRAVQPVALL